MSLTLECCASIGPQGLNEMSRTCEICKKGTVAGRSIARRGLPKKKGGVGLKTTGVSNRKFRANIQKIRVLDGGRVRRARVCTRCLKAGKVVKP